LWFILQMHIPRMTFMGGAAIILFLSASAVIMPALSLKFKELDYFRKKCIIASSLRLQGRKRRNLVTNALIYHVFSLIVLRTGHAQYPGNQRS
jgi:hypothetical protein